MTKYHMKKDLSGPGLCDAAEGHCPLGEVMHFSTRDECRKHNEELLAREHETIPAPSRKQAHTPPASPSPPLYTPTSEEEAEVRAAWVTPRGFSSGSFIAEGASAEFYQDGSYHRSVARQERLLERDWHEETEALASRLPQVREALDALASYQDRGFQVNRPLREVGSFLTPAHHTTVKALDKAFALVSRHTSDDTIMYRSLGGGEAAFMEGVAPGAILREEGYLSTSHSRRGAEAFGSLPGLHRWIMELQVPGDTPCVPGRAAEDEVIFARGHELEVLEIDHEARTLKARLRPRDS